MKGFTLIFHDLKAMIKHKHGRIALGFLLLVPLIYSGLFLSGYWNPYGRLDRLPVAIVNEDQGALMEDQPINAGRDFVKELKKTRDLNFKFVTSSKAEKGLEKGTYYMIVTIPKDFSSKVSTLMDEHPQPAQLLYKDNPGKNYVASQISASATEKMKNKLSNSISKSYANGVFSKFEEMAAGLTKASDGAMQLNQGISDEKAGMNTLANGINVVNKGAGKLQVGSEKLSTSSQSLENGIEQLNFSSAQLASGISSLSQGSQTVKENSIQLMDKSKQLASAEKHLIQNQAEAKDNAQQLQNELKKYKSEHPEAESDPSFAHIQDLSKNLTSSTGELENEQTDVQQQTEQLEVGQGLIKQGITQLDDKLNQVSAGAKDLSSGTSKLSSSFSEWNKGFSTLTAGIDRLSSGSEELSSGVSALNSGLFGLQEGSATLSTKLADAADQTSAVHHTEQLTSMFTEPVHLVKSDLSKVSNYGTGIAPYFLSLALYVGGIMAANILPLGRRNDLRVNGTTHFINKLGLVFSIGFIQALIVDSVLLFGFKLDVVNVPLFILSSVIVSFTFMTFIFMLVTVFGFVGKFAAVTFLVLQLATCGGTFPEN